MNKVVASREFVQRLVEQHAATQSLMQRIFPSMLLSLLRKPPTEPDASPGPNWPLFWRAASVENHHLAGLIWDESTRYQLRTYASNLPFNYSYIRQALEGGAMGAQASPYSPPCMCPMHDTHA